MSDKIIYTKEAPAAIGPYSQAVRAGNLVFCSGQIPIVPATGEVIEGDFKIQAEQVFKNLKAVCLAAGGDLSSIVKLNAFLTDLENFTVFNDVMKANFNAPFPARSAVEISALPKGVLVEVEVVLHIEK